MRAMLRRYPPNASPGAALIAALALPLLLLATSGCLEGDRPKGKLTDLRFEVLLSSSSVASGDTVGITVVLRNKTPAPVEVSFETAKEADLLITNSQTQDQVYSYAATRTFSPQPHTISVREFSLYVLVEVSWHGQYLNGSAVPAGDYRVVSMADGHPQWLTEVALRVG